MDDLISPNEVINRQAAINALDAEYRCTDVVDDLDGLKTAIGIIACLPPAQPEIIRCKDCKWYGRADKRRFYRGMDCLQKRIDTIIPDQDFCSRAERREE